MSGYNTKLIRHLEDQGATVKRTKKGILIMGPSGGTVTMHNTPSDHRTLANEKAMLRRIGLNHLEEKKTRGPAVKDEQGYAAYITEGVVSKNTRKVLLAELEKQAWPLEVTVADLEPVGHFSTIAKGLYAIGYRYHPTGKKRNHNSVWVAPEDIVTLHNVREERGRIQVTPPPEPTPDPVVEATEYDEEPDATDVSTPEAEPEEEEKEAVDREFIDTVDSWTVDENGTPPAVREYLEGLRAAGLEVEVRVWLKQ